MQPLDGPIAGTAVDAILAKEATAKAGYYEDPFLEPFARSYSDSSKRRYHEPIIKRGTYARVCCIDRSISSFLELPHSNDDERVPQIIVLGCGNDTSFFRQRLRMKLDTNRLEQSHQSDNVNTQSFRWYDVDHGPVIQKKAKIIEKYPEIYGVKVIKKTIKDKAIESIMLIQDDEEEDKKKNFPSYCYLMEHDLRKPPHELIEKISAADPKFNVMSPTLFVVECVTMYLPEEASYRLLNELSKECPNSCLCAYEPILGSDSFGKIMEKNLTNAGIIQSSQHLKTCLSELRTLESRLRSILGGGKRDITTASTQPFNDAQAAASCMEIGNDSTEYSDNLFVHAIGCDMMSAYETIITSKQRNLANRVEFLDEIEEFMLIMKHYCFFIACTGNFQSVFPQYLQLGDPVEMPNSYSTSLGFAKGKCVEIKL